MLVLRMSNFQGETIGLVVMRHKHQIFFHIPLQNHVELFSTFLDESHQSQM